MAKSSQKNAYQRYVESKYGPDAVSHHVEDFARSATSAVKEGAGFFGSALMHGAAGLLGAPMGASAQNRGAVTGSGAGSGIGADASVQSRNTPSNRLFGNSAVTSGLSSGNYSGSGYGNFNDIGSRIASDLKRDFGLTDNQAAGIVGNLGHESNGFKNYQEMSPIGGGRGGAGWAQWTGSRRTAFEGYIRDKNLHPQSYEANYGFLKKELTSTHASALAAVKKANTVQDAVYAFESKFEKANKNYKHYAARMQYANSLGASTGSPTNSNNTEVAQLQRDLNSRGAGLKVDGIMGPRTKAALAQYAPDNSTTATAYAPTNVALTPAQQAAASEATGIGRRVPTQQALGAVPTGPRLGAVPTQQALGVVPGGTKLNPVTGGTKLSAVPGGSPMYGSPYTNSTGGANALNPSTTTPRPVPTTSIHSPQNYNHQLPAYTSTQAGANLSYTGGRPVQAVPVGWQPNVGELSGIFNPRTPVVPQTPNFMNPYMGTTGGANTNTVAGVVARLPRARPEYTPPGTPPVQQAVPTTGLSLGDLTSLAKKYNIPVDRMAEVGKEIGGRVADAFNSGMRSGMGYSGGNYSGGTYGGAGGRSINEGVGGAYRNR